MTGYLAVRNHAIAWIYEISARASEIKSWDRVSISLYDDKMR